MLQQLCSVTFKSDTFRTILLLAAADIVLVMQIVHPVTRQTHRIWFESPAVGRPLRDDGGGRQERLFPRDCREAVSLQSHTA